MGPDDVEPPRCPDDDRLCEAICAGDRIELPDGCRAPRDCNCRPPAVECPEPNPQGCRGDEDCNRGEACVRDEERCYPSRCSCDEEIGAWICTRDCVGHCVAAAPDEACDARCREVAQADILDCLEEVPADEAAICREVGQIAYDSCMNDCR